MWRDIGGRTEAELRRHLPVYRRWLVPRLRTGRIFGIMAETEEGAVVGSGCVWFAPDHPRPALHDTTTPYVHSMFTEPAFRGRGVATAIVRKMIAVCRERGFERMLLHAAPAGAPVYYRLGFRPTSEMRLWLDPKLERRMRRLPGVSPTPPVAKARGRKARVR
jgi:GNAT superfamily N-acetyltransferase